MSNEAPSESTHLTVKQAAKCVQVSQDTILGWIGSKELPASDISIRKTRPRWRISKEDLARFMERRRTKPLKKFRNNRSGESDSIPQYV